MIAETNQWYVVWFRWCCRVLDKAFPPGEADTRAWKYRRSTNLCHFFRTLLFGTVVAMLGAGLWLYGAFVIVVLPFMLFDMTDIAMVIATIVGIVAALVGIIALIVSAPKGAKWVAGVVKGDPSKPPGFTRVAVTYAQGVKNRFCPTISFREKPYHAD